jgi:hypothetical protein
LHQNQLLIRRTAALALLALVLVLLIFGFKSCRDTARKNGLRDYNTAVGAIARASDESVSKALFAALQSGGSRSPQALAKQVNAYRAVAATQAGQARDLDVPDAMAGAQRDLLLVLGFRAAAVGAIGARIPAALGSTDAAAAANTAIADQMRTLLTSDVIYSQRVAPLIKDALTDNGITGQTIPVSRFLPNLGWLDADTVAARIGGSSSAGGVSTATAAKTTVAVLNGTQTAGLARRTADKLAKRGYQIGTVADAPNQQHTTSQIAYQPGQQAAARAVAGVLGLATTTVVAIDQATATAAGTAQVVVTAGADQT